MVVKKFIQQPQILNKVKPDQNYIKFKELDLNNIENLNLDETF